MRKGLFQVSTLNALMLGNFDGVISVRELLKKGNWGLGTYEGMDGEAVIVHGTAYNGQANGICVEMEPKDKVAFSIVADLTKEAKHVGFSSVADLEELKKKLDLFIEKKYGNFNTFYFMNASGVFQTMQLRSVEKQQKPYPTLPEVTEAQKIYSFYDIPGVLVGVRCPDYAERLNMPGWHIHFISNDRSKAGHVLGLKASPVWCTIEEKNEFSMVLPQNEEFASLDLMQDLSAATAKAEGVQNKE